MDIVEQFGPRGDFRAPRRVSKHGSSPRAWCHQPLCGSSQDPVGQEMPQASADTSQPRAFLLLRPHTPSTPTWTLAHAQRVPTPVGSPKAPPPPAPCRQTGNLQLLLPALQQVGSHRTTPITPPGTPKSQVHPELTAQPDRSARGRCTCRQACKGVRRQPAPCSAVRPRGCPFPAHPGPLRT